MTKPKYKVDDWVATRTAETKAVPGGDEYSREYEVVPAGSIGQIALVTDENKTWGLHGENPKPVYQLGCGETPLIYYSWRENSLRKVRKGDLEPLENKLLKKKTEGAVLERILAGVLEAVRKGK